MIVRTLLEDGQRVVVRRTADRLDLLLGHVVLLSSAALETERAFGALAARGPQLSGRVVIGGLGFGATLRGALDVVALDARVIVVEKLAAVIDVARNEAAHLLGGALDDPRVTLVRGDVLDVVAREDDLAAILLDVDNGPRWASFRTNARLYAPARLEAARRALVPGGIFAVWSGAPNDGFLKSLREAGFVPRVEILRERGVVRARAYVGVAR